MCGMCGGHFAFLDQQTEHFMTHKDEMCCHLCQVKFSHMNSLALHLKNAHLKYYMFCKSCNMYMGRHVASEWTVDTDKTPVTPKKELLDEEVEEVIIENEEVEIKYVKEEEEEEAAVGRIQETNENNITETQENSNVHDHTYFSTQTCSSVRETTNNVVMYTSSENVLVFINKTDSRISPKDSYTESDQQGTPVDQMVCGIIHDHTYISTQSLANPMLLTKQISAQNTRSFLCNTTSNVLNSSTENIHVFNNKADTRISPKDLESTESDQDQIWKHDHSYFSRQSSEFEPFQEDAVVGHYEETIQRSDHEDSDSSPTDYFLYTSQDDLFSDRVSCTSTDSNGDTLEELCQKQNCENTNQTSFGPVNSVISNPTSSICKHPQICSSCGLSKVPNTKKSMEQCRCTPFICSLCGIVSGTEEMLLSHLAEKHPLAKYVCARCLHLFPNQNIFMQHVCSKSKGFGEESFTPPKSSNNAKEPLVTFLNFVPSSVAAESSKQPLSSQKVNIVNTALNLGTVLNSTLHSLPNSPSISSTQKIPVQVMTTRSSDFVQKKVACLNGDQGQETTSVSTYTQKQIGQVQNLCLLQAKALAQMPLPSSSSSSSPSSISSTQIRLSDQGQGQMTPILTVPQTKHGKMQGLTPLQAKVVTHTPTGSAGLTSSIVLPQLDPSLGVHLPFPILSPVPNSVCVPFQTGQLHPAESNAPFLDICRSFLSTSILPSSQGPLKIVAMFVNQSKELALQKRMHQSWRSKAMFPCRQCGAVSRQFSLGVRHRYQHRGPRIHRCQCGRAFQRRMHLLRHQIQHAEATRYVCAACGQMFCGTQQLACHRPPFRITSSNRKKQANSKECRNIFRCYCGYYFTRPAALLWHMLKNSKARKSRLKRF